MKRCSAEADASKKLTHSEVNFPDLPGLAETSALISRNPAAYHTGASHLLNGAGRKDAGVSEEILNYCAAYIYALGKGSTLAGAKVLPAESSIADHEVMTIVKSKCN